MREKDKYFGIMIYTGIYGTLLNNLFCNILGLYTGANYYRFIFLIEGIIILIACTQHGELKGFGISIKRNQLLLLCIFMISQVISFVFTAYTLSIDSYDIHKSLLLAGMIYACYFTSKRFRFSEQQFYRILNFLIAVGICACIYNFIINFNYFKIRNLSLLMHYTWNFRSFFNTRASYGIFISIAAMAALVKSEKKHGVLYLSVYFFFLINVLITAARTEMAAIIFGSMIYFANSRKYRRLFFVGSGIILLFILGTGVSTLLKGFSSIADKYYIFFNHMSTGSGDFSTGRLGMWKLAFDSMGPYSFFFGHGAGSKDAYLSSVNYLVLNENLVSFHNGYVDMLFENGILGIGIMFSAIISVIKKVKKYDRCQIKCFFYAVIAIVLLANIGDSNALVFSADTLSPLVTVVILTIPNALSNYFAAREGNTMENCEMLSEKITGVYRTSEAQVEG